MDKRPRSPSPSSTSSTRTPSNPATTSLISATAIDVSAPAGNQFTTSTSAQARKASLMNDEQNFNASLRPPNNGQLNQILASLEKPTRSSSGGVWGVLGRSSSRLPEKETSEKLASMIGMAYSVFRSFQLAPNLTVPGFVACSALKSHKSWKTETRAGELFDITLFLKAVPFMTGMILVGGTAAPVQVEESLSFLSLAQPWTRIIVIAWFTDPDHRYMEFSAGELVEKVTSLKNLQPLLQAATSQAVAPLLAAANGYGRERILNAYDRYGSYLTALCDALEYQELCVDDEDDRDDDEANQDDRDGDERDNDSAYEPSTSMVEELSRIQVQGTVSRILTSEATTFASSTSSKYRFARAPSGCLTPDPTDPSSAVLRGGESFTLYASRSIDRVAAPSRFGSASTTNTSSLVTSQFSNTSSANIQASSSHPAKSALQQGHSLKSRRLPSPSSSSSEGITFESAAAVKTAWDASSFSKLKPKK